MKNVLIFCAIILASSSRCFAQSDHELRIYYGLASSELLQGDLVGTAIYDNEDSYELGLKYLRKISRNLSVEFGVNYFSANVTITPAFTGVPVMARQESLRLIAIPLYVNYSLGKYVYINGGPFWDLQLSDRSFDSQSGIGYSLGIGVQYHFKEFVCYLNPIFKRHAVIPFEEENNHQQLTQISVQLGLGRVF